MTTQHTPYDEELKVEMGDTRKSLIHLRTGYLKALADRAEIDQAVEGLVEWAQAFDKESPKPSEVLEGAVDRMTYSAARHRMRQAIEALRQAQQKVHGG
jgi:hypothetical protein